MTVGLTAVGSGEVEREDEEFESEGEGMIMDEAAAAKTLGWRGRREGIRIYVDLM